MMRKYIPKKMFTQLGNSTALLPLEITKSTKERSITATMLKFITKSIFLDVSKGNCFCIITDFIS